MLATKKVACALIVAHIVAGWCASADASEMKEISAAEAMQLAADAMKAYHRGAALDLMPRQVMPGFYVFEAQSANMIASPIVGHFAVNSRTGDVWDTAGFCKRLTSAELRKRQKEIRSRFGYKSEQYQSLHAEKPMCDAG